MGSIPDVLHLVTATDIVIRAVSLIDTEVCQTPVAQPHFRRDAELAALLVEKDRVQLVCDNVVGKRHFFE